ncbi:MAG: GNAT family N-acetyltransferase [Thermomicrobiales bacterium]|nr:GNAT family N-acetyltransferase [Thermomicrobiales bacterium]
MNDIPSRDDHPILADYTVRSATAADAPGIARVQVDGWKVSYPGIVPDEYLAALSYKTEYESRRARLEAPEPGERTFVATDPFGWIVGFVDVGPARDLMSYEGELYAIYVMKKYQGLGIGAWLLETAVRAQLAAGRRSMLLWVLADAPARGFYEAYGAERCGQKPRQIGGKTLEEVAYGWSDLAALLDADED